MNKQYYILECHGTNGHRLKEHDIYFSRANDEEAIPVLRDYRKLNPKLRWTLIHITERNVEA